MHSVGADRTSKEAIQDWSQHQVTVILLQKELIGTLMCRLQVTIEEHESA